MQHTITDFEKIMISLKNSHLYSQQNDKKKSVSITIPQNDLKLLHINIERFNNIAQTNFTLSSIIGNTVKDLNNKIEKDIKLLEKALSKSTRNEYLINDYQRQINQINQEI